MKQLREESGLNLTELATLIGKDKSSVSRYETGQIPADVIPVIAKVLQVSPAYLMGWSDSKVVDVLEVPLIKEYENSQPIIEKTIDVPISNITDYNLSFYMLEDSSMSPYFIDDALVLAKDYSSATDGSLVVILPDGGKTPLLRIVKYDRDTILFISNDYHNRIYTVDDATVLGDVISITHTFNMI